MLVIKCAHPTMKLWYDMKAAGNYSTDEMFLKSLLIMARNQGNLRTKFKSDPADFDDCIILPSPVPVDSKQPPPEPSPRLSESRPSHVRLRNYATDPDIPLINPKVLASLKCDICGDKFKSEPEFIAHYKLHFKTIRMSISCSFDGCQRRFSDMKFLGEHETVCPKGNAQRARQAANFDVKAERERSPVASLPGGGRKRKTDSLGDNIMAASSSEQLKGDSPKSADIEVLPCVRKMRKEQDKCNICHLAYNRDYMKQHVAQHAFSLAYICNYCGISFDHPIGLRSHQRWKHGDEMKKMFSNSTSASTKPSTVTQDMAERIGTDVICEVFGSKLATPPTQPSNLDITIQKVSSLVDDVDTGNLSDATTASVQSVSSKKSAASKDKVAARTKHSEAHKKIISDVATVSLAIISKARGRPKVAAPGGANSAKKKSVKSKMKPVKSKSKATDNAECLDCRIPFPSLPQLVHHCNVFHNMK